MHSTATEERMRVVAPAHPLVVLIGCVQFERLFTLLSFKTTCERVIGSDKGSGLS